MTEEEQRRAFADKFHLQAVSDWDMYEMLSLRVEVAPCHKLHFLQMACEKVAKAYRLRDTKSPVSELLSRHTGFAKFVPTFCKMVLSHQYQGKDAQLTRVMKYSQALAREIEKLTPSIDRLVTPENAEYPWQRGDEVIAPCHYNFPSMELLQQAGGRTFLKVVKHALDSFET